MTTPMSDLTLVRLAQAMSEAAEMLAESEAAAIAAEYDALPAEVKAAGARAINDECAMKAQQEAMSRGWL